MKAIDYKEALKMHKAKFGIEPNVTGSRFWDNGGSIEDILNAIDNNTPYDEKEVKKGILI